MDFGTYIIPLSLFDTATANIKTTKSVVLYKRHATNWNTTHILIRFWVAPGSGLVRVWVGSGSGLGRLLFEFGLKLVWVGFGYEKILTRWRWIVFLVQCNEFSLVRIIVATTNDDAENMTFRGLFHFEIINNDLGPDGLS